MPSNRIQKWLTAAVMVAAVSVVPAMGWAMERESVSDDVFFIEQFDADGDGLVSTSEFPGDHSTFGSLDADGSGYIDETEAPRGGPPPHGKPDPEALVTDFDADGDGHLSADEFPGPVDHFDRLDADGDGLLSADELLSAEPGPGASDQDRFTGDDTDQDGLVSRSEFSGPEDLFDRLDTDGDGTISEWEARQAPPHGDAGPIADAERDQ